MLKLEDLHRTRPTFGGSHEGWNSRRRAACLEQDGDTRRTEGFLKIEGDEEDWFLLFLAGDVLGVPVDHQEAQK